MLTVIRSKEFDTYQDKWAYSSRFWFESLVNSFGVVEIFDDYAKDLVKEIDRTDMIAPGVFNSEWLGTFTYERLSGGVKGLIMIHHSDKLASIGFRGVYSSTIWGENCIPALARLSFENDFTIVFCHTMHAYPFRKLPLNAKSFDGKYLGTIEDFQRFTLFSDTQTVIDEYTKFYQSELAQMGEQE